MKLSEILPKPISSGKYEYEITLTSRNPLQVSVIYKGIKIWSIRMSEDDMILSMFSEHADIEDVICQKDDDYIDDAIAKEVCFMIDFLKSDIKQGFVDKYIDTFRKGI